MSDLIDGYVKSGLVSEPTKGFIRCNGCRFEFHPDDITDGLCKTCESFDKGHRDQLNRELRSEIEQITEKYNELLFEVVNKVDGMSRHDRAKAIIISSEAMCSREAGRVCDKPTERVIKP